MYPLRDTKLEPSFVFSSNHATVIENDELRKTKRGIEPKHLKEWGFLEVVGMSPDDYRKKCPSVQRINTKPCIFFRIDFLLFVSNFERILSNDGALLGLKISFACEGGSDSSFPSSILHASVQSTAIYIYPTTFSCAEIFLAIIDFLVSCWSFGSGRFSVSRWTR